ncbi:hypothetical protein H4R35_001606 [Dimargaris xerosporica]|nr:hypothetical protein H4R35_001606 [Dimargaris xerosporica]
MLCRLVVWSVLVGWMASQALGDIGASVPDQPTAQDSDASHYTHHLIAALDSAISMQKDLQRPHPKKQRLTWPFLSKNKSPDPNAAVFNLFYPLVRSEFAAFINELLISAKEQIERARSSRNSGNSPYLSKPQTWYRSSILSLSSVNSNLVVPTEGGRSLAVNAQTMALPATYQAVPLLAAVQSERNDVLWGFVRQLEQTFRQLRRKDSLAKVEHQYHSTLKKYLSRRNDVSNHNARLFISYYIVSEIIAALVVLGKCDALIAFLHSRASSRYFKRHIRFVVMLMVVFGADQYRIFLNSLRKAMEAYSDPMDMLTQLRNTFDEDWLAEASATSDGLLKKYFVEENPFANWQKTKVDLSLNAPGHHLERQSTGASEDQLSKHPSFMSTESVPTKTLGVSHIIQCIKGLGHTLSDSNLKALQAFEETPDWDSLGSDDQDCYRYLGFSPLYIQLSPETATVTLQSKNGIVD